jgi:hypothetical protein
MAKLKEVRALKSSGVEANVSEPSIKCRNRIANSA